MKKYIIGIDTGGTYTDGVLVDTLSGEVLYKAKTPTTHHNLAAGTSLALQEILLHADISTTDIDTVAISTTLATNSVVENKGARVAVLVIGYVKHFKLPVKAVIFIKGGHTITGEEEEALDLEYLVSIVHNLKGEVDAYGVCSAMSFKNPSHEFVAEKAIQMIDPKPVFCSHRISDQAGMKERAATAGLHAKLMPLMQDYIDGVETGLGESNISSPMRIIGGNAKSIASKGAIEHAGMTVASGPACTAFFGLQHSRETALVIDVGGTTTDVTMIENGRPRFAKDGCRIGKWQTHVEAIDMFTGGVGGDSHIRIDGKKGLHIGPKRVVPIATTSCPLPAEQWLGCEDDSICVELLHPLNSKITNNPVVAALGTEGPCTIRQLQRITQLSGIPLEKQLDSLRRLQCIQETGFTPTDALHVLGELHLTDSERSKASASLLGKLLGLNAKDFATLVVNMTVAKIEGVILEYITSLYWDKTLTNFISTRNDHPVIGVDFSLKVPIIGIGAAAKFFLPQVARNLHSTVFFPDNYEVGNAIGAALIIKEESYGT